MMMALEIMRELRAHPEYKPARKRRTYLEKFRPNLTAEMCKRHPSRRKNPLSASFCDACLNMMRNRYTPKGIKTGRKCIPRQQAG